MNKTIWAIAFVVLACGMSFAITNATVVNGTQSKFGGTTSAQGFTTEGGNVTDMNVGTNASTEKWAGMYGNVTGQLVLSDSTGPYMYSWKYNVTSGGTVCASRNTNPTWSAVSNVVTSVLDTAWGFVGTDADSAALTMTTTGQVTLNGVASPSVASAAVNTANGTGVMNWQTVAVDGLGTATEKGDYAFCVSINSAGTAFNNQGANFQVMVPTNETVLQTEQYFFFVELA